MRRPADNGIHREIEIKLEADAGFVIPDLSSLPGVTEVRDAEVQHFEAVHLDSADLRLIRHGTTFRRRTGGDDAGWHLKLPAARSDRIEVRRALGPSVGSVPPRLLGLVRVQLRGAPVGPVARIITRRTVRTLLGPGDVVLAEIADDQVTAEAMGAEPATTAWRQIEVELVEGDDGLLASASQALITAGAQPGDVSSKLQRALAHRLAELGLPELAPAANHVDPTGKTGGIDKKARHALKTAAPTAGQVAVQYLSASVAGLIAEDPQVRIDAEGSVHHLRMVTYRMHTALASFRPIFTDQAVEPLREELKWLGGLLDVARDAELMRARLGQQISEQPPELVLGPVRERVDLELGQAYRQAHAVVVAALDGERYLALIGALEDFAAQPPFSPRGAAPGSKELRIQEPLGSQPADVAERKWLRDLAVRAFLNGENSFTFGRLHGLADVRAGGRGDL